MCTVASSASEGHASENRTVGAVRLYVTYKASSPGNMFAKGTAAACTSTLTATARILCAASFFEFECPPPPPAPAPGRAPAPVSRHH